MKDELKEYAYLAAKAADYEVAMYQGNGVVTVYHKDCDQEYRSSFDWAPLHVDEDAFVLATDMQISVLHRDLGGKQLVVALATGCPRVTVECTKKTRGDATRRAIFLAAVEIGKKKGGAV